MARKPIAIGTPANYPLTPIVDTQGKVKGVVIMNVSAVDFYASEDPTQLQAVDPANLPTVGLHFPPDSVPPFMLVLPFFNGKWYARAQSLGSAAEVIMYDVC